MPDITRTFDKVRELTTLEHLLADYNEPSEDRDILHYFDFFGKVMNVPEAALGEFVPAAIREGRDLHFHTWTYQSFGEMVECSRRAMSPWRSVWSQPSVDDWLEFYFVLQK